MTAVPHNDLATENYLIGITNGALLSPDDRTLYLTGPSGIYPVPTSNFVKKDGPFEYFNTEPALPKMDSHLGSIAVTHDGHVIAVYLGGGTDISSLQVYTPAGGVKSGQYVLRARASRQFGVSPHWGVAVILTDSSYVGRGISFVPIAS